MKFRFSEKISEKAEDISNYSSRRSRKIGE